MGAGDGKGMLSLCILSIKKAKSKGGKPRMNSYQAVERTITVRGLLGI